MLFRAMKLHKLTLALMIEATSLWGLDPTTVGPRKKMASQQPEGDLQGHNHITHHTNVTCFTPVPLPLAALTREAVFRHGENAFDPLVQEITLPEVPLH